MDQINGQKHFFQEQGFSRQVLCATIGSMWGLTIGPALGFSSVGLPMFDDDEHAPFILDESDKSVFTSLPFLVTIVGSVVGRYMTSRFGPRMLLAALLLPTAGSWLMIAFGRKVIWFFVARTIMGLCGGIAMPIGQMYLTDVSTPATRGFIASTAMLSQLFYTFVNSVIALFLSWHWLAVCNAVLVAAHIPMALLLPESPTWLLRKASRERAKHALQFVRGKEEVEQELKDLEVRIIQSRQNSGGLFDLFKLHNLKPVVVLCIFISFRQFTGAFAVFSYTVDIFASVGGGLSSTVSTVIVNAVQLTINLASNGLSDKFGRKKLLVSSAFLMGVAHLAFGSYYYQQDKNPEALAAFAWVPLASLIFYCVGFSAGFASALYVLMTELIPLRVRSTASAVTSILNNFLTFVVIQYYYTMKHNLTEAGLFWLYGGVCLVAGVYCIVFLPETSGKSLAELEATYAKKKKLPESVVSFNDSLTTTSSVPVFDIEKASQTVVGSSEAHNNHMF
ncbi:unnamed protein product [Notodromas monacha]|uniref:Major facilitator superfamily (MFS) profile domain-containing protein n=1 Tax=Notodromas monacha TaxID=399045 RepID=A0A7R9BVU3_9CRUS|nr:unnamed protein product [Notodromas monacha]CAG0922739.1 unnamed protein product [Notodromas monacha]